MTDVPKNKSDITVKDFMDNLADFGAQNLPEPLSKEDRDVAIVTMASNLAFVQLIMEGIIPVGHELHFQAHFADFIQRLNDGEGIKPTPDAPQTIRVDSPIGKLYADTTRKSFENGTQMLKQYHDLVKELLEKMESGELDEQTNNLDKIGANDLDTKRTLN